jgi:excisionase family DNA binding protein
MQTHEEKKARMRSYYRANKHKWKKYNRDALARMTDEERTAYKERQSLLSRQYYEAHREEVIQRTSKYNEDHKDRLVVYRATWFQENKRRIAAQKRRHYHAVEKPRQQQAKATSEFVTVSQAVELLGAKLRTFREWVYQGRIPAIKTPGGRFLLRRADVEEIRSSIKHIPEKIRQTLGLSKNGDGA